MEGLALTKDKDVFTIDMANEAEEYAIRMAIAYHRNSFRRHAVKEVSEEDWCPLSCHELALMWHAIDAYVDEYTDADNDWLYPKPMGHDHD